jgi:hypothetical protein
LLLCGVWGAGFQAGCGVWGVGMYLNSGTSSDQCTNLPVAGSTCSAGCLAHKKRPPVGPYSSPLPRHYGGPGGVGVFMSKVPLWISRFALPLPIQATQGPSCGYFKSQYLTGSSSFGDCSPQNGSKTVTKSQNRPLGYPHEGPFVVRTT